MLFEPFQLGSHTLRNRLVALPVFSGYALPNGRASDLLIDHYHGLARSGVALVVVANAAVGADGMVAVNNLRADADEFVPGLERLARTIKTKGALAILQLNHGGRFSRTPRPLSPSALNAGHIPFQLASLKEFMEFFPLEERFGLTRDFMQRAATWTRSMSPGEKETVIAAFGQAAARACKAGFDGVELHGATGYLLTQFLSGFTHRDASGSPAGFKERIRFPLQVVREVKRRLPAGFLLGFRLLLHEWVPGGIDLAEALAFAEELAAEGIGYLSPSSATYHSMFLPEVRALTARPGYLREDCRALAQRVAVPIIVSGRVLSPQLAEQLLAEGAGDLIGLGRGLRADPRWISKARSGQPVTACRNCNVCLRGVVLEQGFSCTRWPGWIRERADLEHRLLRRDKTKTLWVVAGAGDMELMRTPAAAIPALSDGSTTILFLKSADPEPDFDRRVSEFTAWSRTLWQGLHGGSTGLLHKTAAVHQPPDSLIAAEMAQGGFGAVILGRNHRNRWRDRFVYRQRAKAVSLIGTHPRWSQVLVALDLGLASLLVLRHLEHTLMTLPESQLDFVHVLQKDEKSGWAFKRWREIHKILGWRKPAPLRTVALQDGDVSAAILRELRNGDFGTLVMGKRGLSRIKQLLLGSVSSAVLQGLTTQTLLLVD